MTVTGRNEYRVKKTVDAILHAGVPDERVHMVIGDLTEDNVRTRLVESTIGRWGHLDVLVNSAGGSFLDGKEGFEASDNAYMQTMDINLRSVIQLVRLCRPHLIRSKGEIVNISSINALNFGFKQVPYYAISKAGLDQFTRALAIDLIGFGVRVNGVSPGIVETDFMEHNGMTSGVEESKKVYKFYGSQPNAAPYGSNASAADIANIIAFLADRSASSVIVGQMIVADGGTSLIMGAYTFDFEKVKSA